MEMSSVSLVANSLQSGQFWVISTSLVYDDKTVWENQGRKFCTVIIQDICGRCSRLFQSTEYSPFTVGAVIHVDKCVQGTLDVVPG